MPREEFAHFQASTLGEWLVEHRRLALCRGNLAQRVRVLRTIIALGGEKPGWIKDLGEYEVAYLADLCRLADEAHDDIRALENLQRELSGPWRAPGAARLQKKVQTFLAQVKAKEAEAQRQEAETQRAEAERKRQEAERKIETDLTVLAGALNEAMNNGNVDAARDIRKKMATQVDEARRLVNGDLAVLPEAIRRIAQSLRESNGRA